ncbi:MAG: hypothetical protein KC609_23840, partial [Myxococcales bacterium]|nr:hypothetical protein [Myxococcales bacterium]
MRFPQIEARHQIPRDSDRLLVIFSDIEMGAGGVTDDFPRTDFLAELILSYNSERYARCSVDLVFNGDTFDFLKTPVDGAYPSHITPAIAVAKLDAVAAAHADFFEALRDFVAFEWP